MNRLKCLWTCSIKLSVEIHQVKNKISSKEKKIWERYYVWWNKLITIVTQINTYWDGSGLHFDRLITTTSWNVVGKVSLQQSLALMKYSYGKKCNIMVTILWNLLIFSEMLYFLSFSKTYMTSLNRVLLLCTLML